MIRNLFTQVIKRNQICSQILQKQKQNKSLHQQIPKFNFFFGGSNKQEKGNPQKQKLEELNAAYKEFLEEQRFNIRKPYEKDYFITDTQKKQQLKTATDSLKEYLDTRKFDHKIQGQPLLAVLSNISYCYENQQILDDPQFQKLILDTAERCYDFEDMDSFCLFLGFCSVQNVPNIEGVWEMFANHIQNNIGLLVFTEKLSILKNVNDRNYHELGRFFDAFENSLLEDIHISKSKADLLRIQEILSLYRNYEKGSDNFYFTLQELIKENVKEVGIPVVIALIQHYGNNIKETIQTRNEMMELFEEILMKKIKFLNQQELLQVMFSYTKFGKGSDLFFQALDDRVMLQIDEMSIQEVKNLMIIAQNRSGARDKVYLAVEGYLRSNINKIQRIHIPELFFYFSENLVGSPDFYQLMESKLLEIIFTMNSELLSLCAWSFAVNQHTFKADLFFKKLGEAFPKQMENASIKDMSRIVWSLCKVFKENDPIIDQIEEKINSMELSGKDCAQVLWGFILNKPLQGKTLEKIVKQILQDKDELDGWDLSTILWSFSKFEDHDIFKFIYIELHDQTLELIDEMSASENVSVLRSYIETGNESDDKIMKMIEQLEFDLLMLSYDEVVLSIHCLMNMNNVEMNDQIKQFILVLKKRAEDMVKLIIQEEEKLKMEHDINSVEYYEQQEKLKELKQ